MHKGLVTWVTSLIAKFISIVKIAAGAPCSTPCLTFIVLLFTEDYTCQACRTTFPTRYHLQQHSIFEHGKILDVTTTTSEASGIPSVKDCYSKIGLNTYTSPSRPVNMVVQSENMKVAEPEKGASPGMRRIHDNLDMAALQQQYYNVMPGPVPASVMKYLPYPHNLFGHYAQLYANSFGQPVPAGMEQGMDLSVKLNMATHRKVADMRPKKKIKASNGSKKNMDSTSDADSIDSFPGSLSDPSENAAPEGSKNLKPPPTIYMCVYCNDRRFTQTGNFHILEKERHILFLAESPRVER